MNIVHGDCLEVMRGMADNSVDSIVTDPPYGLSFMGKKWDYDVPGEDIWRECLRVLKPGGHMLAFAGTRTQHRMAVRIEDAGFEIRDMIAWVYGSGFPKSLNVGKVLDKFIKTGNASWNGTGDSTNGALGYSKLQKDQGYRPADYSGAHQHHGEITEEAAKKWQGWGTALKPAMEPITVARKPLVGTVAANVLAHGTGGLNIDGCRVGVGDDRVGGGLAKERFGINGMPQTSRPVGGRWPANLIHDGSDEVVGLFPQSNGAAAPVAKGQKEFGGVIYGKFKTGGDDGASFYGDSGSAARFFYCAKASKKDRDEGCEGMDEKKMGFSNGAQLHGEGYDKGQDIGLNRVISRRNHHPTVKPTDLMRYLCRLVTPPGGIVLDPFAGSGSTGKACALEGFRFIGIEREAEYCEIARARIAAVDVGLFGAAL
jgi:site-specific DNA-methyltransferase (adenine-specific)